VHQLEDSWAWLRTVPLKAILVPESSSIVPEMLFRFHQFGNSSNHFVGKA
jgi:hypothetical protein